MASKAEAQNRLSKPVLQVMAAAKTRKGEVTDLVLLIAAVSKLAQGKQVRIANQILVRQSRHSPRDRVVQRNFGIQVQHVKGYVRRRQIGQLLQIARPV